METDYDVLGLAALPNDDELLPQIFAPDFMQHAERGRTV